VASLFGLQVGNVAIANPFVVEPISPPVDPEMLTMNIQSPTNYTLYSNETETATLQLEVNINRSRPQQNCSMQIDEVYYVCDWLKTKSFIQEYCGVYKPALGTNNFHYPYTNNLTISKILTNMPNGNHSITIYAQAQVNNYTFLPYIEYYFINCSSVVYFTVQNPKPNLQLYPQVYLATIGVTIATAIMITALIIHFRKRRK